MLAKALVKPTREETAIFIARATIGQACLGTPFSDDELREVVRHVEVTYGAFDERPEQFHAVAAAAALQAAKFANWYGSFGYDTEREIAGRSSLRYWLDHAFGENNLGAHWVTKMAKLPPERFELDVAPEPKSSARCCSGPGPKHKFGVGEPRLALSLWEPGPMDSCAVVRERLGTCCLDAACVRKFEREHGVSIADAVPAAHLGAEARAAVEARQDELVAAKAEGAPPAPAKSEVHFPGNRKRETTRYECGKNPWGELEVDLERVAAEGARRAEEVERLGGFTPAAEAERKRKAREDADEERKKRYRPTLDQCKDAVVDEANPLCAYVFEKDPEGRPGPVKCPYDRKEGLPFCSQCTKMVDALRDDDKGVQGMQC